jgi:Fe-S oxidoreductase
MNPWIMALLLLAGWGTFAYSARRRWQLMRVGAPEHRFDRPAERLRRTIRYALAQVRMRRYPLAGAAHMVIFLGFAVLLLRSLILWGRGFDESFHFWLFGPDHLLGRFYSVLKDLFAVLVILAAGVFFYYRVIARIGRLTLNWDGLIILGIIVTMMAADILYDGASFVLQARSEARSLASLEGGEAKASLRFKPWEPAGSVVQYAVAALPEGAVNVLRHVGFWTHGSLVLIFLNLLPYSKHFHIITAVPNVYTQNLDPPGRLPPITDIEGKLEREETLGVRRIDQFSWKAVLDFYTCTECGRCSDHCPATKTGKKLSPKHFTVDLRNFLYQHEAALIAGGRGRPFASGSDGSAAGEPSEHRKDLVEGVIDPEVLWACTTCRACEEECPVFISYVDKIVDMRRYLVQERGEFPNQLQAAFRGLETNANPWSFSPEDRAAWAEGLGIQTLAENPQAPVLFWVGCAPSFDERSKRIARATAKLLRRAGVEFAILGTEERCTGDPARRAGNEFLFQTLARGNVEVLNGYEADKKSIVTTCPHCFNTLLNEYPDFGGRYRVVHHSQFLSDLVAQGRLTPTRRVEKRVVFHDSCYLGRYNDVYDPPRNALRAIPGLTLLEPTQTRDRGMCCGAGGAQMFKEEEPGTQRVNALRTSQLLETRPDAVSSACPFCLRMLTDGLADKQREDVPAFDVAELLIEAVEDQS